MNYQLSAIALLLLTVCSCSGDEPDVTVPVDSDMQIELTGEPNKKEETTRADMKGLSSNDWVAGDQFVVDAHYYYSTTTTLAQQFMHQNGVTYTKKTSGNAWYGTNDTYFWNYAPVKYWPQQGYLDFFACYPRDYYDHNLDRLRLFHENMQDTIIATRFYLDAPKVADAKGNYHDAEEQWDLMFSHRPHLSKPDVTTPVKFLFSHAEMAVRFWTGDLEMGNNADFTITEISLNNIHTGGALTALDDTNWQQYYTEFGSQGVITNTAKAQTPVRLRYTWDWQNDPYAPDIRDTYTQTMDYLWAYTDGTGVHLPSTKTQINPGNKVFIIPPQCLGETSGSSITVHYIHHDAGGAATEGSSTFNVDFCGKPGSVLDIILRNTIKDTTGKYLIEVVTATLIPWEDVYGKITTDLEK